MDAMPRTQAPTEGPHAAVAAAQAVLRGMVAAVAGLGDAELVELAGETEALGRVVDALRVRIAGEVDERSDRAGTDRLSGRFGCRSAVELLERITGVPARETNARIRLAARTRPRMSLAGEPLPPAFPAVADALTTGTIGVDAARCITDSLARVERRGVASFEALEAAERELVATATGRDVAPDGRMARFTTEPPVTFAELRVHVDTWTAWLDADGFEPDAEQASRRRGFTIGPVRDGLVPVRGDLMPETAASLQRLFDAYLNPAVRFAPSADHSGNETALGMDPEECDEGAPWRGDETVHDPRTTAQKRHDVLTAIIQSAAGSAAAPTLGGAAPTLVVTVDADALTSGGTAELAGVDRPVPVTVAHRIACTGAVQKVVFDRAGRIIRLGTPERLFNTHQRRAIAARDRGCVIPGCAIPAAWCEVHHVEEHAHGGQTHTDNGVLLCWWHHHNLDRSGWAIRMHHGTPHVRAPGWIDRRGTWRPAIPPQRRKRQASPRRTWAPPQLAPA